MLPFERFGPPHLAIVAAAPAIAWALGAWSRGRPGRVRTVRAALAAVIAVHAALAYLLAVRRGWVHPPDGLPLDLCDVTAGLTVAVLIRPRPWSQDLVYYLALAGTSLAILMPDVAAPLASIETATFFVAHVTVVAAVLFLVWKGGLRPRPGSWWRALAAVNGYALLVGLFDAAFGTNYMYLCRKPAGGSLLDVLGPWPLYLVAGDALAAALTFALFLPWRRTARAPAAARREGARP